MNYKKIAELSERLTYLEQQLENIKLIQKMVHKDGKGVHVTVEHELTIPQMDDSESMTHPMAMFGFGQEVKPNPPYDSLDYFHVLVDDIECLEFIYAITIMTQTQIKRIKTKLNQLTER